MGNQHQMRGCALVDLIHTGGRGMVSFSGPGPDGWRDRLVPARKAVAEAAGLEDERDRYVSIAQFRRSRRISAEVMSFGALAIDLDNPASEPEALAAELLDHLRKIGVPEPSVIVATGNRGLHLWWGFEHRIPAQAAGRWRATASWLVTKLKGFGADPTCVDPARVMRLPGTIHGDTGVECRILHHTGERVDFEDLFAAAVPLGRAELEHRRKAAQEARERRKRASRGETRTSYPARVLDALEHLATLRGGFRPDKERNIGVHIAACMLAAFLSGEELTAAVLAFGHRTTNLPDTELITCARSALSKRKADGKGYRYRIATILDRLEITPDEAQAIGLTVASADARRERNARCQREARRKAGARPHAHSRERAKPWAARGVSRPTWYRRRQRLVAIRARLQSALERVRLIRVSHTVGVARASALTIAVMPCTTVQLPATPARARSPPGPF